MPGSGAMSYTNYKLTTKSNPYLGSILPDQTHSESSSHRYIMPMSKTRTVSRVKHSANNPLSAHGGRRKREINNVIREAHEMESNQDALLNNFNNEVNKVEKLFQEN